jgi:hypothetical protein
MIYQLLTKFPPFIKPQGLLPCSQEPPEPDESTPLAHTQLFPQLHTLFLSDEP